MKKNVWSDIIKMILEYLPIAALETLKEWKMVIISVEQEYKFTEEQYDYRTRIGTTYSRRGLPMNIGKLNENFKDRKPRYFNCNIYRYIVRDCWRLKKKKDIKKCYKCEKVEHIAKDCKIKQRIKNKSIQEESNNKENNDRKKCFIEGLA